MAATHYVVIGDVVGSRDLESRQRFRSRLATGLAEANARLAPSAVRAPFDVRTGIDEVGAVLTRHASVYTPLRIIAEAIHPVEIRFAVVYGEIDVAPDADDVSDVDGPAFHRAEDLLAALEAADRYVALADDRDDAAPEEVLSGIAGLMDMLFLWKGAWTERQCEVVRIVRETPRRTDAAARLDVSDQAVSNTLKRARAGTIFAIEDDLAAALAVALP